MSFCESGKNENSKYVRGFEILKRIDGNSGENVIKSLNEIAPDIGKYIVEFAFGEIYGRAGLNDYQREMITLACLLTLGGCEAQLKVHIKGALNAGLNEETVVETFIQCIPYAGFPKVLNAVYTAESVFDEKNI